MLSTRVFWKLLQFLEKSNNWRRWELRDYWREKRWQNSNKKYAAVRRAIIRSEFGNRSSVGVARWIISELS